MIEWMDGWKDGYCNQISFEATIVTFHVTIANNNVF